MARTSEWSVAAERTLSFEGGEPVRELRVRTGGGTVNVVGAGTPAARLEIGEVSGPPLTVRRSGGTLFVGYDDVPGRGFLPWLGRRSARCSAVVSVTVPASARVRVRVVDAAVMVSGVRAGTEVKGVGGQVTLVGLGGEVEAETVSGDVDAQALHGTLRFHSVSGGLTVVDDACRDVRGESVSGDMVVDVVPAPGAPAVRLNSVSGELAVRLPDDVSARVSAGTAGGAVSSAFGELSAGGSWGARELTGVLGGGAGEVRCTTVSGSIALLRRPPAPADASAATASRKDV
jgi:hypothetical protein